MLLDRDVLNLALGGIQVQNTNKLKYIGAKYRKLVQ